MDTDGARAYSAPGAQEPSPAEALRRLQQQIGELQTYLMHFISARIDAIQLSVRQTIIWVVLGVVGFITLAALLVISLTLLLGGTATGIGLLFGGRLWVGQIAVGSGVIILLALGTWIGIRTWQRQECQQKVQAYDERQRQQRSVYGHSVADRPLPDGAL